MKWIASVLFMLCFVAAPQTFAHGELSRPKHGGVVAKADPIEAELVATASKITVYVSDHGKALDVKGAKAKLTLLTGKEKSEVNLVPAGENRLEATGTYQVGKGTRVVGVISLPNANAVSLRWVVR
jgi:hypothetical protein